MSSRFVWEKFEALDYYEERTRSQEPIYVSGRTIISRGQSYSFSSATGRYRLNSTGKEFMEAGFNSKACYFVLGTDTEDRHALYRSNSTFYFDDDTNLLTPVKDDFLNLYSENVYAKGAVAGTVSAVRNYSYPTDGVSGSYWYTYRGEDSIYPTKVSYPASYTVIDEEGGPVTVTEQVGGLVKRTFACALGQTNQYQITGEHFMRIPNGGNVIKITATDEGGLSTVLTLTFTKAVHAATVMLARPLEVEEAITMAIMSVLGSIPAGHIYAVEATNNAKDTSPVWQDVTAEVKNGVNIVFTNRVQANGPAFNFRLRAARGQSSLPGYIQSIQGGFQ